MNKEGKMACGTLTIKFVGFPITGLEATFPLELAFDLFREPEPEGL